jgi:AGCS family alanine or glycine:cation symporter
MTSPFFSAELCIFAFCTVIGWYYCGETAFRYLTKSRYARIFCVVFAIVSSSGALFHAETVWTLSDIFNGLMAFPNLMALILLIGKVRPNK